MFFYVSLFVLNDDSLFYSFNAGLTAFSCLDCSRKFLGALDGLFHIYHIAISGEGGYKVSSDDSMHLVEALRLFCFQ